MMCSWLFPVFRLQATLGIHYNYVSPKNTCPGRNGCERGMVFATRSTYFCPLPPLPGISSPSLSDRLSWTFWNSHSPPPWLGLSLLRDFISRRENSIICVIGKRKTTIIICDENYSGWAGGSCEHSIPSFRAIKGWESGNGSSVFKL